MARMNWPIRSGSQSDSTDAMQRGWLRGHEVRDAGGQQQAGEHPAERADQQLLDERRGRADAQPGRECAG